MCIRDRIECMPTNEYLFPILEGNYCVWVFFVCTVDNVFHFYSFRIIVTVLKYMRLMGTPLWKFKNEKKGLKLSDDIPVSNKNRLADATCVLYDGRQPCWKQCAQTVSYTHLDVYKRQDRHHWVAGVLSSQLIEFILIFF